MPVTAVTGAQFTVTVSSTAYTSKVTAGSITRTTTVSPIKTLTDRAFPTTDDIHSVELEFLYDEETGLAGVIDTAQAAGNGLSVSIAGADAKWTGTLYVTESSTEFAADGVAMTKAKFTGSLTFADAP